MGELTVDQIVEELGPLLGGELRQHLSGVLVVLPLEVHLALQQLVPLRLVLQKVLITVHLRL